MAVLDVYMNGYLVGELTKSSTGSHQFAYAQQSPNFFVYAATQASL